MFIETIIDTLMVKIIDAHIYRDYNMRIYRYFHSMIFIYFTIDIGKFFIEICIYVLRFIYRCC